MNPNPKCQSEDCRFQFGLSTTTCMYFPPVYDKNGNNVNPDGNITSGEVRCSTCLKTWYYSTQYDITTYKEVQNGK
jgi:hypothetical protein